MVPKIIKVATKPVVLVAVLSVTTFFVMLQDLKPPSKEGDYGHYNNYLIFTHSYHHLVENKDLYDFYRDEYFDLYKYSPAFALFIAPFSLLPDPAGLFLWDLLNVLVLFFALWKLPFRSDKTRLLALAFIIIELIVSIQNSQSNALIAGLIIFAFLMLEKGRTAWGALFIVSTVFIKLFGLVAFALFIFYPHKLKAVLYSILWALLLAMLPLLVITPHQLFFLYQSWFDVLCSDHTRSYGISVAGFLNGLGIHSDSLKNVSVMVGAILFVIPLFNFRYYKDLSFRLLYLSSILIWIVIFNHMAESPSFVIAVTGITIWFFSQPLKMVNLVLLIFAFILTNLGSTDVYPVNVRDNYILPFALKALPCTLIWLKIVYDQIFFRPSKLSTHPL